MWENPNGLASSVVSTTGDVVAVDGGFQWNGRGFFSSGVDHCNWLTALVHIVRDGEREGGRQFGKALHRSARHDALMETPDGVEGREESPLLPGRKS